MQDSALDFVTFIIILGIVVKISLGIAIPMVEQSKTMVYSEQYNKTVSKSQGDKAEIEDNGSHSIEEIVLQIMGQSYYMPEPRVIDIAGNKVIVEESQGFSPNKRPQGLSAYGNIENWAKQFRNNYVTVGQLDNKLMNYGLKYDGYAIPIVKDMRFKIQFDYGSKTYTKSSSNAVEDDDTYALFVVIDCVTISGNSKVTQQFKCLPNGDIQLK